MNIPLKKIILLYYLLPFFSNAQSGSLDPTFGNLGIVETDFPSPYVQSQSLAVQSDGKIVALANVAPGSNFEATLVRYEVDGDIDLTFGTNGVVVPPLSSYNFNGRDIVIQSDGKFVIAGFTVTGSDPSSDYDFAVVRLNTDGSLDNSFNTTGILTVDISNDEKGTALEIDGNNNIVCIGNINNGGNEDMMIIRVTSTGLLDNTFDSDGIQYIDFFSLTDIAYDMKVQPDNKIIVVGYTSDFTDNLTAIARLNTDGTFDNSFSTDGKLTLNLGTYSSLATSVDIQSDNKIVVAVNSSNGTSTTSIFVRLEPDGDLDISFSADGLSEITIPGASVSIADIRLDNNEKIVCLAGDEVDPDKNYYLIRLDATGALDLTFGTNGIAETDIDDQDFASKLMFQTDNKILVTGITYGSPFLFVAKHMPESFATISPTIQPNNFTVFPNPTNGNFVIQTQNEIQNASIKIVDISGKIIYYKENISGTAVQIDLSNQPAGIYFLELNDDQNFERIKIVKE